MRKVFYFFGQILYLPHVILFLFSSNKTEIIQDIYARKTKKEGIVNHSYYLSLELVKSSYFRTLFYHRTRGFFTHILRIFYPKNNTFTIDVNTNIGGGLQLAHPYSTILNAKKIGENVYVNHLVTLGEKKGEKPTIGNNVELHAGCIVIGGIVIGDNAIIGAGAVVTKEVPENTIVVGNPARIIDKK